MGDIDMTAGIKKVCNKRVNESSQKINQNGDGVLVSDGSVAESPVFSVESVSTDTVSEDPMVPITPHSKWESVEYRVDLDDSPNEKLLDCDSPCNGGGFLESGCDSPPPFSSPIRDLIKCDFLTKDGSFSSEDCPCTPKKDVFDPFAPGPDKLNWAPYCRKFAEELEVLPVVRKLQFDLFTEFAPYNEDLTISEEEIIFQSVYSIILEVIISSQSKENGNVSCALPLSDGCRTPIDEPRLSGIADTCPGAPIKGSNRFKMFDKEICRKIEF